MRWVLAGLAFALLVTLAVATVAIKAHNVALRARIAATNAELAALHAERARRVPHLRPEWSTAELQLRLAGMLEWDEVVGGGGE